MDFLSGQAYLRPLVPPHEVSGSLFFFIGYFNNLKSQENYSQKFFVLFVCCLDFFHYQNALNDLEIFSSLSLALEPTLVARPIRKNFILSLRLPLVA